jgi:hypothetical protein
VGSQGQPGVFGGGGKPAAGRFFYFQAGISRREIEIEALINMSIHIDMTPMEMKAP